MSKPEGRPDEGSQIPSDSLRDFADSLRRVDETTDADLEELARPLFGPKGNIQDLFEAFGDYIDFDYQGEQGIDRLSFAILAPGENLADRSFAESIFGEEDEKTTKIRTLHSTLRTGCRVNVYRSQGKGPTALSIKDVQDNFYIRYYLEDDGEIRLEVVEPARHRKHAAKANARAQLIAKGYIDFISNYELPQDNPGDNIVNPDLVDERCPGEGEEENYTW